MTANFRHRHIEFDRRVEHPRAVQVQAQPALLRQYPGIRLKSERQRPAVLGVLEAQQLGNREVRIVRLDAGGDQT